jgi:hypothetical protein
MNMQSLPDCASAGAEAAYDHLRGRQADAAMMYVGSRSNAHGKDAILAFAEAAIRTYLKLNPFWVSTKDRLPTAEDANILGEVAVYTGNIGGFNCRRPGEMRDVLYWTSAKHLPVTEDPFDKWLEKQPADIKELG